MMQQQQNTDTSNDDDDDTDHELNKRDVGHLGKRSVVSVGTSVCSPVRYMALQATVPLFLIIIACGIIRTQLQHVSCLLMAQVGILLLLFIESFLAASATKSNLFGFTNEGCLAQR